MLESGARRGRLRRRTCSACVWDGAVRTPARRRSALTLRSASAFRNQAFLVNAPKNGLDPCLIPPRDPVVRVDRAADLAHFSHRCHAELPHEQLDVSLVACAACAYLHCEHVARRRSGHDQIGRLEEHLRGLVLTIRQDSVSEDSEHTLECDPQALGIQCRLGDAPCSGRGSAIDRRGAGRGKGQAAAPYPPRDSSFVLLSRLGESVQAHRRYLLPCSLAH